MYASLLLSKIKDVLQKIALIFFDENNNLDVQDRNIAPVKTRKGQTPASSCTLNYFFSIALSNKIILLILQLYPFPR